MTMQPPRSLLVPVDFTATSRAALAGAADLARRFDASITVVHVEPAAAALAVARMDPEALEDHIVDVQRRLQALAREVLGPDREAEVFVEEGLLVAESILRVAVDRKVDWICMGAGGKKGWTRLFLGSTAAEVVRRSPIPVLTLRGRSEDAEGFVFDDFRRVLVATDLSEGSDRLVALGARLATPGGSLTLAHVIEVPAAYGLYGVPMTIPAENLEAAKEWTAGGLQRLVEGVEAKLLEPFRIEAGRAAERILAMEDELQPDVTVVGTHGRHGLDRVLLGSVAERVVRGAGGPVLVVPLRG